MALQMTTEELDNVTTRIEAQALDLTLEDAAAMSECIARLMQVMYDTIKLEAATYQK